MITIISKITTDEHFSVTNSFQSQMQNIAPRTMNIHCRNSFLGLLAGNLLLQTQTLPQIQTAGNLLLQTQTLPQIQTEFHCRCRLHSGVKRLDSVIIWQAQQDRWFGARFAMIDVCACWLSEPFSQSVQNSRTGGKAICRALSCSAMPTAATAVLPAKSRWIASTSLLVKPILLRLSLFQARVLRMTLTTSMLFN